MWELDYKESWAPKNWCFWTVVLERTLESPLDCKEIKPVNPKGNQSWIFTERTDAEAETPIFWPPDVKSRLNEKDPDAGSFFHFLILGKIKGRRRGWQRMRWLESESEVTQSCLTLCDPMNCSLPGSSHPWDFPGNSTGVGCHFLFQGIFLTQGLNRGLPHCSHILYQLNYQGRPPPQTNYIIINIVNT